MAKTAAEICEAAEMEDRPDGAPGEFVQALAAGERFPDAVKFIAFSLPKREAVWWAWFCARGAAGPEPPPKVKAALAATETWIAQPEEDNRRKAMEAAEAAGFDTPAGCAALGAFFSGGSMAPAGAPELPPGEHLTAKAVAGAVTLAALTGPPEKAPERYGAYIA